MSAMLTCETTGPARQTAVRLPFGLFGFEPITSYALVSDPEESPFLWLQMLEAPNHSFLVLPPQVLATDYQPDLDEDDVAFLGLTNPEDACLLNIVTLHGNGRPTVNLKGPIVINRRTGIGKQVIPLNAASFPLQYPLPAVS